MSEDGVDCSLFNETLNEIDESNEYLILYKQLLRQKMTDSMNDLTAQLVSYKRQMPQRRLLFSNASNSNNNAKNIRGSMLSDKSAGLLGFPSANPQQQQMKEMFPGSLSPPRMVKTLPLQSHVTAPPRRLSRPVAVRRPISGMPDLMHKSQEM